MIILSATGDQTQIVLRSADMSSPVTCIFVYSKLSLGSAKTLDHFVLAFCELFLSLGVTCPANLTDLLSRNLGKKCDCHSRGCFAFLLVFINDFFQQFGAGVYLKNSPALETGITLATGGSDGNRCCRYFFKADILFEDDKSHAPPA